MDKQRLLAQFGGRRQSVDRDTFYELVPAPAPVPVTANARNIGSKQIDAFKSHNHGVPLNLMGGTTGNNYPFVDVGGAQNKVTNSTGLSETRPVNTALHPRLCL